jgi:hypothetical protein
MEAIDRYKLFCEQLNDAVRLYPNLKICQTDSGLSFLKGVLDIPNDVNQIVGSFAIEIYFWDDFPYGFPLLFEVGGIIPNEAGWHKYAGGLGNCCITAKPDEVLKCKNGISVPLFIEKHAIPYFANQIHRMITGKYKNGEYSHNVKGFPDYYESLLKTNNRDLWLQYFKYAFRNLKVECERNDICFCGSGKKYKQCHLEVFITLQKIGEKQVTNDFNNIFKP